MVISNTLKTGVFTALFFLVTACGSGGGVQPDSSRSTNSASSSTNSSDTGQSSSTSSSQASEGQSSSSPATHTSAGDPYCTPAGSDPDGDGWGWEDDQSCVVRHSAADPDTEDFDGCVIDTSSWIYCSVDNTSWGVENGEICVSQSFCPANRTEEQAPLSESLVNADADATTQAVYDYLRSVWGEQMLSGQQDLTWQDNIDMYQRVLDDTGKAPAIMGYDFMNYGSASGSGLQQTEEAIEHWNRGGLVTFAWHWRDPLTQAGAEFYTDRTDFEIPIANGHLDTQSPAFNAIEDDIDTIAAELKTLQDAGVPVLWRPLHEASGGWFWWGRPRTDDVPPAFAQVVLWRHLYHRLTEDHGLNNVIWVWNGQGAGWYPGDAYVDIVGQDVYADAQDYGAQEDEYQAAHHYPLQQKLVALTETSNIPDPDKMAETDAWWLWFVVWNDIDTEAGVTDSSNFWTGEYYNTQAHKEHVYQHEKVITLDELPDFSAE